jgi:hypothetical protein
MQRVEIIARFHETSFNLFRSPSKTMYYIYTDGSAIGNPG